ncbi:MAG: LemA family protein [Synergistetes bacterium]|nr:LemA family protein [Synergistota bacterium]MDW8192261.1 LemA family protein [Synergistota bacterium]
MGWIILVVLLLIAGIIVIYYNRFITLRNRVDNAWAQIEVQLKRRADLIPNLVETVKGYASHEKETFEKVTQARSAVLSAKTPKEFAQAEGELTTALKTLFAIAEAYPELKANSNFQELQKELAETENKIAYTRQFYNDTVLMYNNAIETFPGIIIARLFNFTKREFFKAEEGERIAPKISF